MRVLVTGSRDWPDQAALWSALDEVFENRTSRQGIFLVVHGGAKGADTMARLWASGRRRDGELSIYHEMHQAQWMQNGQFVKAAGHQRNQRMVDKGADLALAFIRNNSPGASGCARMAEKAGIPVTYYRINDQEES
jgi:YspA, cpYpsA-related SLOG family